ncbi:Os02g0831900 [Prunus dulcis]|uniref:Os02g0831900 n=1 Tax=Prunus dulcis TaxID=3755 RepID=A0A5E4FKQ1_PRUDU|nr:Os02g0831900 [Prunus dulcis]
MAENCFSLESTAESRGLSGAMVSSMIHGWQRTSWAVTLFLWSLSNIFLSRSLALSEILGHGSDSKSGARASSRLQQKIAESDSAVEIGRIAEVEDHVEVVVVFVEVVEVDDVGVRGQKASKSPAPSTNIGHLSMRFACRDRENDAESSTANELLKALGSNVSADELQRVMGDLHHLHSFVAASMAAALKPMLHDASSRWLLLQ